MSVYKIENKEFVLKDLSLDELDQANKLLQRMEAADNSIEVQFTNEELKQLLAIILEPKVPGTVVNMGAVKETVVLEIIKDFFLKRISSKMAFQKSMQTLLKKAGQP